MSDNLELWNRVSTTRPEHTKAVTFGRKFTAICPQSQRMKATEVFGPYGIGWGIENESFEVVSLNNHQPMLLYRANLWYILRGKDEIEQDGRFPIVSSIQMTQWNKNAGEFKLDDECYKKAQTDALTKGLSFLGFNADVFLGMYDDNRYVESLKNPPKEKKEPTNELASQTTIDWFLSKCSEHEIELPGEIIAQLDERTITQKDLSDYWNDLKNEHGI